MADDLGVSTSYLNLIERNQRPMSAKVLVKLAELYEVDISDFSAAGDVHTVAELAEVLRDPVVGGQGIGKAEIEDVVNTSPELAKAFVRLHARYRDLTLRAYSETSARTGRRDGGSGGEGDGVRAELLEESAHSVEQVRAFINENRNYFPEIDRAAEDFSTQLSAHARDLTTAMVRRLGQLHNLRVRVLPAEVMPDTLRYFDRHSSGIDFSELLPESGRRFQLAFQLALLEHGELIRAHVAAAGFSGRDAADLARVSLTNYFAAAILMPYGRFLEEAERTRYDVEWLSHRFETSFEQTAHRLTTLQRPDARGIPFFFVRIDRAGNVSKRFSSGRFHFSKFGGSCPLWNVHACFETPGQVRTQIIQLPDTTTYFSIARTVTRGSGTFDRPVQLLAVGLGCDIAYAPRLAYAATYNLDDIKPTPIGINCYLCERPNCRARAHAPLNRRLTFDERELGMSVFRFEDV